MKNNFPIWSHHYDHILRPYYDRFSSLLINYGEAPPSYREFLLFCYQNTQKSVVQVPGFAKELSARVI